MAGGSAIRGSRVGAGPMGEAERGESIARFRVSYWCANGHETKPSFAEDGTVEVPSEWDCPRCGFPARCHNTLSVSQLAQNLADMLVHLSECH